MNKENKKTQKSKLSRQIIFRYFLSMTIFFIMLFFIAYAISRYVSNNIWFAEDPLYRLLSFIREYILIFAGLPIISGMTLISYYFVSKPLRYLDDVIDASEKMITSKDTPVRLAAPMKNVQDELNLFREQALRNERAAREAEQRKNDLIVYLAPDLKTPLTSVIGYLSLLRDEPQISSDIRAKYTGIALEKAQRLEDLINEFFDITRFNLSTPALEEEPTNLSRMLEQISYEFNPILSEKNLSLDTDIAPDIEILCDRNKMERVFDNLIRNAINYSYPNTRINLTMSPGKIGIDIIVSNHGKTIPADKLDRIFEQFFRLDSSRSTSTGGSGLGLAISKEIVELHGGLISASSENEMITLTVTLPYKQSAFASS